MTSLRALAINCMIALSCALPAKAEIVSIHAKSGEVGHGWLFGSTGAAPGACWIAAPAHVVAAPETAELQAFTFTDRNGVNGESEVPLPGGPSSGQTLADREAADLSFARVANGRKDGSCLSRLGVPTYLYQNLMTSAAVLTATSLLKTSLGEFGVSITRGAVDALGGSVLDFRPVAAGDVTFLQKGLSGATVTTQRSGDLVPFAMILRVDPKQNTMRGLRFDYIRERFEAVEREAVGSHPAGQNADRGTVYRILNFAVGAGGKDGPSRLLSPGACWRASAPEGSERIELQIEIADPSLRIETLQLAQNEDCTSGPLTYFVEQRVSEASDWVFAGKCRSDLENKPCRIGLQAPRQFRIRIDASRPIAVSGLQLR